MNILLRCLNKGTSPCANMFFSDVTEVGGFILIVEIWIITQENQRPIVFLFYLARISYHVKVILSSPK